MNDKFTNKRTFWATFAAFFSNFIFGFSFLFSNMALKHATPSVLLALRFLFAFAIMNLLVLLKVVKIRFKGKNVWQVVLMGLMQPVIYFYCESYGIEMTSATFAAIMIALVPVGAMVYSAFFMKEPPTFLQAVFGIISVLGVILLSGGGGGASLSGTFLLIGAIITAVGFNAVSRKSAREFNAFERTYIMFAVASLVFTVSALLENRSDLTAIYTPLLNMEFLISILYLGVLSSVIAFMLINYANTYLPISRTTIFSNVITVVSIFAGILILKDTEPSFGNIFYSIMIITGIFGVQKFAKE
ncbi:MAG: DMT family transporter [Ruminococcaceae bacterium]|nr:DMT family transporter [Oscillospiraceae bacterium]